MLYSWCRPPPQPQIQGLKKEWALRQTMYKDTSGAPSSLFYTPAVSARTAGICCISWQHHTLGVIAIGEGDSTPAELPWNPMSLSLFHVGTKKGLMSPAILMCNVSSCHEVGLHIHVFCFFFVSGSRSPGKSPGMFSPSSISS